MRPDIFACLKSQSKLFKDFWVFLHVRHEAGRCHKEPAITQASGSNEYIAESTMARRKKKTSKQTTLRSRVRMLIAVLLTLAGYLGFRDPAGREFVDSTIAHFSGSDQQVLFAGMPVTDEKLRIIRHNGFIVGYDEQRKNPRWVAYRLDQSNNATPARSDNFRVDRRTRARVKHEDFSHTGYDRGHMAPSAAIGRALGERAQDDTFYLSNISPQQPTLNRNAWRRLEALVGEQYTERYGRLWVITGPIFDEYQTKLPSGIEVPDAFYKVVLRVDRGHPTALAMVVSQHVSGDEPIASFLTSVDHIEMLTGLNFYPELDDSTEVAVEARVPTELWHQGVFAEIQDKGFVPDRHARSQTLARPAAYNGQ